MGFFEKAEERAKKYCWVEAAELYGQALGMIPKEDFMKLGTIQEEIGYCFYQASMQAESREEFDERTRQAIDSYGKAQEYYERLGEEQKRGRTLRCESVCKYLESWLTSDLSEKNKLLAGCLEMAGRSLAIFSKSRDKLQYGVTYDALSFFPMTAFFPRIVFERDRQVMREDVDKGLQWGKEALDAFSESGDKHRFASVYLSWITCLMLFEWFFISDPEEQDRHNSEVMTHLGKLLEVSQEIGDTSLVGCSHFWLGFNTDKEESIGHLKEAVEASRRARNKLMEATAMDFIANRIYWKAIVEEVPDERRKLAERAMEFYDEAQHYYSIVPWKTLRGGLIGPPGGHAEHRLYLAEWETDLGKKRELLEKAVAAGVEALKEAESSYPPNVVSFTFHILSRILEARSCLESNVNEKRGLLERAIEYEEKAIQNTQWKPHVHWNTGLMHSFLADLKAELGYLERTPDKRRKLLEEAALSKEECLKLIAKQEAPYYQLKGVRVPFVGVYRYQDTYGTLLNHLYELTGNPEHLSKIIEISKKALEWHARLGSVTLVAESYWKIAKAEDMLGEHLEAAVNFSKSAEEYTKAAKKIPQLKDLYQDYATYMLAWNEIEKAKHHHVGKQYGLAKEHYEKAASLHQSTERWNYLTQNYLAWTRLEEAEDLSRREQTEDAKKLFQQAANLFEEAKSLIKNRLDKTESAEKEHLAALIQGSDTRREYCLARYELEEAKTFDRRGDHAASSKEYGLAAEKFQKIMTELKDERSRKELEPILCLSKAWQAMTRAEAESSPHLYSEASQLFDLAKEQSHDEKARLLALGHSSFCKALEAGAKFEATRDPTAYSTAKKHVEAATNYYLKAGFETASEYAKATYRLFDAYMYMYEAQTETDPEKKARLYEMAERLLKASADSYSKAKHPEKSEQVQRMLESIGEERQLAISLMKVLHAPTIASTTVSFSTLTPTQEKAVGFERFEHADVQTCMFLRAKEAIVGDDIDLEIECTNTGKAPAALIRIEELVPGDFVIRKAPETCRLEDSCLNLRGRRLDPLKTEEIKLVLRAANKGTFVLKPKIEYLDETGTSKYNEPKPVTMTVKEIGIKGWLKGRG